MTDITYDKVTADAAHAPATVPPKQAKGFWRTMLDAMVAARMRQAERLLEDHNVFIEKR